MPPSTRATPTPHRNAHATTPAVDSPVFHFHGLDVNHNTTRTNGGNQHNAAVIQTPHSGPWTADEHERFLQALEQYGGGPSTSVFATWHAISAAVATRSVAAVKAHANRYYAQLQDVNVERRKEYLAMQQIDARWTMHEDTQLEAELASHIPVRVTYPWETIARRVPGKSPRETRERYHKLCYDISRIESGQHVMMRLSRHARLTPAATTDGANGNQAHALETDGHSAIDCIVTLTPQETQILLRALEHVPVSSHAPPDVLAAVASSIAVLACSKHKRPPQRTAPQFSVDDAQHALEHAIHAELRDPVDVLELLASELNLRPSSQPQPQPMSIGVMMRQEPHQQPPVSVSAALHDDHSLSQDESMQPSLSSFRAPSFNLLSPVDYDTRAGEELLTHLKTSPVHDPRRTSASDAHQRLRGGSHNRDLDAGGINAFPLPSYAQSSFPYSLMPSVASTQRGGYSGDSNHHHREDRTGASHHDDSMDNYF